MSTTKEYREFFLRTTAVTSGSKPDQESGFPTKYLVKGEQVYNRFLAGHFPSENVMKKFLESIAFKLNPEDTASTSTQGLVKKALDANAEARAANTSSDITAAVVTHQLPEVVLATDVNDTVVGTAVEQGGLKLTTIKRTINGLFRRNYKLEVNPEMSIIVDGTTKKIRLSGDVLNPGNDYVYGTNSAGTKGWQKRYDVWKSAVMLEEEFSIPSDVTTIVTGITEFRISIPAAGKYKFRVWMPCLLDSTDGARVNLQYSGTISATRYRVDFMETASRTYRYMAKKTAMAGNDNWTGFTDGFVEIHGTLETSDAGMLTVEFGTQNPPLGSSSIQAGSYFEVEQIVTVI